MTVKQECPEPLTLQITRQVPVGGGGRWGLGGTLPPPELLFRLEKQPRGDCNVTGVGAGAQRPAGPEKLPPSDLPPREGPGGAGSPRLRLPLPPRPPVSSSSGLAPTFFGFRSHILLPRKSSSMTMDLMSPNGKLLTPQQASAPPPPPSTYPNHLPSGLPTSTLQLLPSLLFPLRQTPPKPFTNSSAPLASCALQST